MTTRPSLKLALLLVCHVTTTAAPANDPDRQSRARAAQWRAYGQALAARTWTTARRLVVPNDTAVDQDLTVVVTYEPGDTAAMAVVDEQGRPVPCQADDLDGDGRVDAVCLVLPVPAGQQRSVALLSGPAGEGPAPGAPGDLNVSRMQTGSWPPIRTQPSSSPGTGQMVTYISATNRQRCRRVLQALAVPVPMHLVACDDFHLLVGDRSAVIEGFRPTAIPSDYAGSFLREIVPEHCEAADGRAPFDAGEMIVPCAGPVRCRFEWPGAGRQITVYRSGLIESSWARAPRHMQIIVCAYPYQHVATGPDDIVRFSQMLERHRPLDPAARLGFFGHRSASLYVHAEGAQATRHAVWLDAGGIGWEAAMDRAADEAAEDPAERLGRLCAWTYLAGGMHVTSWQGDAGPMTTHHRVGRFGQHVLAAGPGLMRVAAAQLAAVQPPTIRAPDPQRPLRLAFERSEITVNRLHPNDFHGWELRPVRLAAHNPQPAYFAAALTNQSAEAATVALKLAAAPWVQEASLLLDPQALAHDKSNVRARHWATEKSLAPGGDGASIDVPAGATLSLEVVLRPREKTLGRLACHLTWEGGGMRGTVPLAVVVRPTLLFMPYGAPTSELSSAYANISRTHIPVMYDKQWYGGRTPERTLWMRAAHRDYERHGFWTIDYPYLKNYLMDRASGKGPALHRLPPLDWAREVLDAFADPVLATYRARIYLHDEIWEITGGYKNRWRHLSEVIDLDRMLVRHAPNAVWPSFQQPAIDVPFQYHVKLPNDVPELFYYSGRDEQVQAYARKLVEPSRALFARWVADPGFRIATGDDEPRQLLSYWISTQLHVTRYEAIRRQIWWLRHLGIESFNSWSFAAGGYAPYAGRLLHLIALPIKTPAGRRYLLTDRGLGWMDVKRDMELVTLLTLLADEARASGKDPFDGAALADAALEASESDDFERARHVHAQALLALRPDLADLVPPDLYRGPVRSEALPNLFEHDDGYLAAQALAEASIPRLPADGLRPPPTIDARLDNAYVEHGAELILRDSRQGRALQAPAIVHLTRDDTALYVLFDCTEPTMSKLRANVTDRDGPAWADDCVEIFVDRAGTAQGYDQIIVTAAGTKFDQRTGAGTTWSPDYEVATRQEDRSWHVELALPFALFGGPPAPGETWRMNFCRERKAGDELGSWSVTFGSFGAMERFGRVTFP